MNLQVIGEEEKMAGIQRLSRRYNLKDTPQIVQGREDYRRFKLNELFKQFQEENGEDITLDQLYDFLEAEGAKAKNDPTYRLEQLQKQKIAQFFEEIDDEESGRVKV